MQVGVAIFLWAMLNFTPEDSPKPIIEFKVVSPV